MAINDTVSILRQRTEFMKSQKTTVEPSALLKAFGDITSTGQCSFSQIDEDKKDLVQLINDKLKSLPRFNYSSYTIFDRQQCKGTIRIFSDKPFWISLEKNISYYYSPECEESTGIRFSKF